MVTSTYTMKFSNINARDVISVGSKNAILGDIYSHLSSKGINVPNGFAITSFAFEHFLTANSLHLRLNELMNKLDKENFSNLRSISSTARALLLQGALPYYMVVAIRNAYEELCNNEGKSIDVAVRSSASAENLPLVSFSGLHESFLNIGNIDSLLDTIKKCFASLYSDRAIKYREDNHYTHAKLFFSVGVQKMIHAENGCFGMIVEKGTSGNIIDISAVTADANKNSMQREIFSDHYKVSKSCLLQGKNPVLSKKHGNENDMYSEDKNQYNLSDTEITTLAKWAISINNHFAKLMDLEWIKEDKTNALYIVRAKPAAFRLYEEPLLQQQHKTLLESILSNRTKAVS